jgi:excisionase family DNA binding protein
VFRGGDPQRRSPPMSAPLRDLTLAEVADLRRLTPRYLRDLIRQHGIPVLRSGRLIRFDAYALAALEEVLR